MDPRHERQRCVQRTRRSSTKTNFGTLQQIQNSQDQRLIGVDGEFLDEQFDIPEEKRKFRCRVKHRVIDHLKRMD